jgi:hypothetical protein
MGVEVECAPLAQFKRVLGSTSNANTASGGSRRRMFKAFVSSPLVPAPICCTHPKRYSASTSPRIFKSAALRGRRMLKTAISQHEHAARSASRGALISWRGSVCPPPPGADCAAANSATEKYYTDGRVPCAGQEVYATSGILWLAYAYDS